MDLLDQKQEACLHKIIEGCQEEKSHCGIDGVKIIEYRGNTVASLLKGGYIQTNKILHKDRYFLTHKGEYYFDNKETYINQLQKDKKKESIRYWITTGIAIAALIVAIVSIIIQR